MVAPTSLYNQENVENTLASLGMAPSRRETKIQKRKYRQQEMVAPGSFQGLSAPESFFPKGYEDTMPWIKDAKANPTIPWADFQFTNTSYTPAGFTQPDGSLPEGESFSPERIAATATGDISYLDPTKQAIVDEYGRLKASVEKPGRRLLGGDPRIDPVAQAAADEFYAANKDVLDTWERTTQAYANPEGLAWADFKGHPLHEQMFGDLWKSSGLNPNSYQHLGDSNIPLEYILRKDPTLQGNQGLSWRRIARRGGTPLPVGSTEGMFSLAGLFGDSARAVKGLGGSSEKEINLLENYARANSGGLKGAMEMGTADINKTASQMGETANAIAYHQAKKDQNRNMAMQVVGTVLSFIPATQAAGYAVLAMAAYDAGGINGLMKYFASMGLGQLAGKYIGQLAGKSGNAAVTGAAVGATQAGVNKLVYGGDVDLMRSIASGAVGGGVTGGLGSYLTSSGLVVNPAYNSAIANTAGNLAGTAVRTRGDGGNMRRAIAQSGLGSLFAGVQGVDPSRTREANQIMANEMFRLGSGVGGVAYDINRMNKRYG